MSLAAHTITKNKGSRKTAKRVGRGNGSGKGTYSTRGLKGQRSRSGGKGGLKRLGFKQALQKIPKLRGFTSLQPKSELVTLQTLERICSAGDVVTPKFLKRKGVVDKPNFGVKIVFKGELNKKIIVKNCKVSKTAAEAITKAGGEIIA